MTHPWKDFTAALDAEGIIFSVESEFTERRSRGKFYICFVKFRRRGSDRDLRAVARITEPQGYFDLQFLTSSPMMISEIVEEIKSKLSTKLWLKSHERSA